MLLRGGGRSKDIISYNVDRNMVERAGGHFMKILIFKLSSSVTVIILIK